MRYNVSVNRKFQYVKVYRIIKHIKGEPNAVSKFVQKLVDKYVLKKKQAEFDKEKI